MKELTPREMQDTVSATGLFHYFYIIYFLYFFKLYYIINIEFPIESLFTNLINNKEIHVNDKSRPISMKNRKLLLTRYRFHFNGNPCANYDIDSILPNVYWLQ